MAENDRRPLVLLHGWGMSPRVWAPLRAALEARFDIHAPALPGHADAPMAGSTLDDWADALAPSLPAGALVCGWSLGAMLAMTLALRHPSRVARLALTGATPRFVSGADWLHGLDAAVVEAFRQGYAEAPAATLRRFIGLQIQGESQRRTVQSVLADTLARRSEADDAALGEGLRILAEADLRAAVRELRQPCLLVHGDGDALMPPASAQWLAQTLPHARLQLCGKTGHAPFLSDPTGFAAHLAAFADE